MLRILDPCKTYAKTTPEKPSISPMLVVGSWDEDGAGCKPKWVGRRGYAAVERGRALRDAWKVCRIQNNLERVRVFSFFMLDYPSILVTLHSFPEATVSEMALGPP